MKEKKRTRVRELPIPDHVRAEWRDSEPIDTAKCSDVQRLWRCSICGHEWRATLIARINRQCPCGCPRCRRAKARRPVTAEMRAAWADNRSIDDVAHTDRTATWRCSGCQALYRTSISWRRFKGGSTCFACKSAAPRIHLRKRAPTAAMRADWAEDFPIEEAFHKQRCRWVCRGRPTPCGYAWEARFDNRLRGDGCPKCAGHVALPEVTAEDRRRSRAIEAMRRIAGGFSFEEAGRFVGATLETLRTWAGKGYLPKTAAGCARRIERLGLTPLSEGDVPLTHREVRAKLVERAQRLIDEGAGPTAVARAISIPVGTIEGWFRLGFIHRGRGTG